MKLAKFALVKSTRGIRFNAYSLKGAKRTLNVAGDTIDTTGRSQQIKARTMLRTVTSPYFREHLKERRDKMRLNGLISLDFT
jgi:hypothetical protein